MHPVERSCPLLAALLLSYSLEGDGQSEEALKNLEAACIAEEADSGEGFSEAVLLLPEEN